MVRQAVPDLRAGARRAPRLADHAATRSKRSRCHERLSMTGVRRATRRRRWRRLQRPRLAERVRRAEQRLGPRRGSRRSGSRARGRTSRPARSRSARPRRPRRSSITGVRRVPRVVEEERALAADHLELVAVRAAPCRSRTARARRPGSACVPANDPVGAGRADHACAVDASRARRPASRAPLTQ